MDKKKKQQEKGKGQCKRTGKQSIKSLQRSGAQITNIVVTDNNIKSFDRVARKYGIDYSLKKVEQEGKTEYLVFFKAKDVDVMTAAFMEYTSETLKKQKRESVRQKLERVKADDVYGGRLPVHVRCLIDECANIGQIPKLEKLVATIRSREISACLVLQAQSQLKAIYKDNADTIIGNMDTSIFLGGKEPTTLKELAAVLGKETIDTYNTGESRGRETSHSLNYQKLGKELMSQDELAVMDGGKCILQLRGVRPFLSDKYDITRHPNFKYTADADKRNTFDIEAFLSARLKLKPDEVCDVYEVDTEGV